MLGLCLGPVGIGIIAGEIEDGRQDILPLAGRFAGEGIGLALFEEGRVNEGVVIHVQDVIDPGLGHADARLRQGLPPISSVIPHSDLQLRLSGLAPVIALADHIVALSCQSEFVLDLHLRAARVHQVIVRCRPPLPPQRPGDAIQQR